MFIRNYKIKTIMEKIIKKYVEFAELIIPYAKMVCDDDKHNMIYGLFHNAEALSVYFADGMKTQSVRIGFVDVELYSNKISFPYLKSISELEENYNYHFNKFKLIVAKSFLEQ